MKKNVLVFPCGSEVGLEIHRSLNLSTHVELYGGSSVEDHGRFVYKNYVGNLPFIDEPDFIDKINEVIATHRIDYIIPAHDSVLLALAQASADASLDCFLVTSPLATCEIARSKVKTYQFFEARLPVPKVYESVDEVTTADFPIFLKPDVGQGSRGTHLAKSPEEANFYLSQNPSLVLLEYLPGKEYTIDCFTNKDGKLLFDEGRQRNRISNGISVNSTSVNDERFDILANKINDSLEFRGAWFFQVKENRNGELILMEIAPRIAGTMGLARCKGVNMALLSVFDAMDYEVSIFENAYQLTIDRALGNRYKHNIAYEHVYLDFDDLVIFEGKVNPGVMSFVYQCLNKSIQVHLLTKHKSDLEATLSQYKLQGIFDDIIWISDQDDKHQYITEEKAIFIDDSFAERKKVHDRCHIPVFDSHTLESLMEIF